MGYRLGDLEDALLNRIREQLPYLAEVDSYQGQIDEDLQIRGVRFPAVLALLADQAGDRLSKTTTGLTPTFRLLVCCHNLRGEKASRRENDGAYQILDDLKDALIGQKLGLNIDAISFVKEESTLIRQDNVVYSASYALGNVWP
jgi:phage gp37-like protein